MGNKLFKMENIKNKSFKIQLATAVSIVIFVAAATWSVAKTANDVDTRIEYVDTQHNERMLAIESNIRHLMGKTDLYTERYEETIQDQQDLKVDIAKIQTKLSGIEVTQALILKEVKERN